MTWKLSSVLITLTITYEIDCSLGKKKQWYIDYICNEMSESPTISLTWSCSACRILPTWTSMTPAQRTCRVQRTPFLLPTRPNEVLFLFLNYPLHYNFMQFFCSVAAKWHSCEKLRSPHVLWLTTHAYRHGTLLKKCYKCPEGILNVIN